MARNLDMFSFLPDSILSIIISLLPYKEAARTSILSKQWLEAWRDLTKIIEFNELFFMKPDESKEARRKAFLNFIMHWISHYTNQVVDKFSLKVSDPQSCQEIIERCVAFATQRGVKELSLDFSDPNWKENNLDDRSALMQLPQHVYELGSSLESLKLYSCGFSMPNMLNFRSLKEISLGWIEISESTLKTLLRTCKMVENLSLYKCGKLRSFDMGEEELGLKRLVIDKCWLVYEYINLNVPNLEFFKYSGRVWFSFIDIQPYVMEEAEIDFPFEFEPEFVEYGLELCTILRDFCHVKVLTLCSFLLQNIPSGIESLRKKCDLSVKHLILKTQMHPKELIGFTFVLNLCPWLEKLTLEISPQRIYPDYKPPYNVDLKKYWEEIIITPRCLRKTLKVVEIKNCVGSSDEMKAWLYLIEVGKVLEEMNIHVMKDEREEIRRGVIARYLSGSPRASKNLNISIA